MIETLLIDGGIRLRGEVTVSGGKNAAVAATSPCITQFAFTLRVLGMNLPAKAITSPPSPVNPPGNPCSSAPTIPPA